MTPDEYCQDKAAKSGSSFYYSFLFLPPTQRQAIMALYAFCREVDDVVDECHDANLARVKLDWWRVEIARTFAGAPEHPVGRALVSSLERFNLPQEYFLEIIDGMEMDLTQTRYETFTDLSLYCYRVASVVGLMAAEIFGYQDRATQKYAHNLGLAFQLTNILRDVGEDAARGRIYLPLEDLARFGVSEQDILQNRAGEGLTSLLNFQAQRARDHYALAFSHLPEADRYAQRSGLIMAGIYQAVLHRIERNSPQVLTRRVSLNPLHKLWLAWRTARREGRRHQRLLAAR